jgi:hypothetical protein
MPKINALVDLAHDGIEYLSRVEDFEGPTVWVAAPLGGSVQPPELGSTISLRWSAGVRGRYVADASLRSTARPDSRALRLWNLGMIGPPIVDQRRHFVRAGGGEVLVLERRWARALSGLVTDIGEGGLRGRFPYAKLHVGEPIGVRVMLGGESLTIDGWVLRTEDDTATRALEVTVTYELPERDADTVRRYVMQQQILARRTAGDAAS